MTPEAVPSPRAIGAAWRSLVLLLPALLGVPMTATAQSAVVAVEENLRASPNGTILGQLHAGAPVEVVARDGGWSQVTVRGTIWIPSLQTRDGGQFDLIVTAEDGENLRSGPSGDILGRLGNGTLLNERGRSPGWVDVERTAWIWTESLGTAGAPPPAAGESPSPPATPVPVEAPGTEGWIRAPSDGGVLLAAPDGDTLAAMRGGAELQALGREGNWTRVRMEGWVWTPGDPRADPPEQPDAVLRGVTAAELAEDPEAYRSRVVEMEVQFISLERAGAVRSDFREGEPFLLTRTLDAERKFVYVAIPGSEVEGARRLTPLDRLVITGRVRTGAAALTGNPVLDLLEMRTVR